MQNHEQLKELLRTSIDAVDFFAKYDLETVKNNTCPFHEDTSPSLSIDSDGQFICHGCLVRGTSVVDFYAKINEISYYQALAELYAEYIRPTIEPKIYQVFHDNLMRDRKLLDKVHTDMGLTDEILQRFSVGWNRQSSRLTIPIINEFGICINIRQYDLLKKHPADQKYISWAEGYGGNSLFPLNFVDFTQRVLKLEGEKDTLLAYTLGYNAVTSTSGVSSWNTEFNSHFKGSDVVIIHDVNDPSHAGEREAVKRLHDLYPVANTIKKVELPIDIVGGDFADFFLKLEHTTDELNDLIEQTAEFKSAELSKEEDLPQEIHKVNLAEASKANFYYKRIEMQCLVAGQGLSPYLPPRTVLVSCPGGKQNCSRCRMSYTNNRQQIIIDSTNKKLLSLINVSETKLHQVIRSLVGVPKNCALKVQVLQTMNIEAVSLVPAITHTDQNYQYVTRLCYYIGHGLESNKVYTFKGFTVAEPKQQFATQVLTEAIPIQHALDTMEIDGKTKLDMKIFQPKIKTADGLFEHFKDLYGTYADCVTHIKGRFDLHIAMDLPFFSALHFEFNNQYVNRGWLDVAILGDTRTGKTQVAEALVDFYQLGDIATGENCSHAGLIGGLVQLRGVWVTNWGKLPQNDRRLVIIDEVSAISLADIEKFSRVRSEGIAAIEKIQKERTRSRTRIQWLSNPRSGRPLSKHNSGVEALVELMGKLEDVSRFDYAVTVATGEVSSDVINIPHQVYENTKYPRQLSRNLVLWAWTRTVSQVSFTPDCTNYILSEAVPYLTKKYSSEIPLIQAENVRIKLARLSAAVAARCYSTDGSCEKLIVEKYHAEFVVRMLEMFYDKPSFGYKQFSHARFEANRPIERKEIYDLLKKYLGADFEFAVNEFLNNNSITKKLFQDISGLERFLADIVLSKLVRYRALRSVQHYYVKQPAFVQLLQEIRRGDYAGEAEEGKGS
jgi:hypothetical protein